MSSDYDCRSAKRVPPAGFEPATLGLGNGGHVGGTEEEDRTSGEGDKPLALALALDSEKPAPVDPDLARVVEAWPDLAEPIRRAVLALVSSRS
jgi:hypothetical protein